MFHSLAPEDCLALLHSLLAKRGRIVLESLDPSAAVQFSGLLAGFTNLAHLPGWGNARDVGTLSNKIMQLAFATATTTTPSDSIHLPEQMAMQSLQNMLTANLNRSSNINVRPGVQQSLLPLAPSEPSRAPPGPSIATATSTASATSQPNRTPDAMPAELPPDSTSQRDPGVDDATWAQLERDKEVERNLELERQRAEALHQQTIAAAKKLEEDARIRALQAKGEAERKHAEQLRLRALEARRKQAQMEALVARQKAAKQQEAQVQQKLRSMGVCVAGYQWIKQSGGYRCAGGSHVVTDSQLGI